MSTKADHSRGIPRRNQLLEQPGPSRLPLLIIAGAGLVILIAIALLAVALSSSSSSVSVAQPARTPLVISGQPLTPLGQDGSDPAIGELLPTIAGTDLTGAPMSIAPDDGAQVIVILAHWCPHCQAEVPRLVDYLADTELPSDVKLVALTTAIDPVRPNYPPNRWLEREEWGVPTMVDDADNSGLQALGVPSFPGFVFVDADGRVVSRLTGEISMDDFDAALRVLSSE